MQSGLAEGMNHAQWQEYQPVIDQIGGTVSPTIGGGSANGRYLYLRQQRLCVAEFDIRFGATGSSGDGTGGVVVSLPVQAMRQNGVFPGGGKVSGSDKLIGTGFVGKGTTLFNPNYPLNWIIADVPGLSSGGLGSNGSSEADNWCQAFCPYGIISGSGSIPATNTSLAVTFPQSFPGTNAASVQVTLTSSPGANGVGFWLTSVSGTGFTINIIANAGAATTFSYQVLATGTLMSQLFPDPTFGNDQTVIKGLLTYETAA